MTQGPFVKSYQGAATSANALLPPQKALIAGDGIAFEDAPDVELRGSGLAITGGTRVSVGPSLLSVYRYNAGTNIATIGKTSGLTKLDVANSDGSGRAIEVVGAANETGNTLEVFGSVHAVGSIGADVNVSSKVGFFLSDKISDATAAGYATGLAVAGSWVVYSSSDDDAIKAVRKDLAVNVLAPGARWPDRYGTASTTDDGTDVLLTIPLPDNRAATFRLEAGGAALPGWYANAYDGAIVVDTGVMTEYSAPMPAHNFGLSPSILFSWSAGTLTLTARGPYAAVAGTADNGGGFVRIEIDPTVSGQLTAFSPMTVDIANIVGTTEANGTALVATYVDPTHFDLLAIAFVNAWVSGGDVVLHDSVVMDWSGFVRLTISGA